MLALNCWSTALQVPVRQAAGFGGGLGRALAVARRSAGVDWGADGVLEPVAPLAAAACPESGPARGEREVHPAHAACS
jgi:hypothetical protein